MSSRTFNPTELKNLKREAKRLQRAEGVPHVEALNRIAVREGYPSWWHLQHQSGLMQAKEAPVQAVPESNPTVKRNPLIETTREEAAMLVKQALEQEPRLTDHGIGVPEELKKRRKARDAGQDPETIIREELARGRKCLSGLLDEVAAAADWIKRQQTIKSFNRKNTSYGYKHSVEKWFQNRGAGQYVANGAFIAAALGLGHEVKQDGIWSPNVYFKFSQYTATALEYADEVKPRRQNPGRGGRRVSIAEVRHLLPPGTSVITKVPVESFTDPTRTVYEQFYRWLESEHGEADAGYDGLHNRTFLGRELRERLRTMDRRRIREKRPTATKKQIDRLVSMSDLGSGPQAVISGRGATYIGFEGDACFVRPASAPGDDAIGSTAWQSAIADFYFRR